MSFIYFKEKPRLDFSFKAKVQKINPITENLEPYFPKSKYFIRRAFGLIVLIAFVRVY